MICYQIQHIQLQKLQPYEYKNDRLSIHVSAKSLELAAPFNAVADRIKCQMMEVFLLV